MADASELSMQIIFYSGDDALTFFVESVIDESARDPFDILAELEEHLGHPIALS